MKPSLKTPDDKVLASMLEIANNGKSEKGIAEAVSLPDTQFRRCMAALVDRGLLTYDRTGKVWITTERGHRFLESIRSPR